MKTQGVSVVICCHNGGKRLRETIRHIALQRVPDYIPWEVIMIDNGCTDDSSSVARSEWQKHRVNTYFRIVSEPMLGLSFARMRGFREACYSYVLLCDDDNWLEENYVRNAYHLMLEKPNIGALGGLGKLAFEVDPDVEELSYVFAAGEQAPRSGKVKENRVYGAGCVIRRSAWENLVKSGFKSFLTDRRGAELSSGGDYELCYAIAILGYDIWYDERLRFTHYITRERLTWAYFVRYAVESSKCFNVLSSYRLAASNARVDWLPTLVMIRNFLSCTKILIAINIQRLIRRRSSLRRPLYFRHLMFKYKWVKYFSSFGEMVAIHRQIMEFRERCRPAQHRFRPVVKKDPVPALRLSFFSKPGKPLR